MKLSNRQVNELATLLAENLQSSNDDEVVEESAVEHDVIVEAVTQNVVLNEAIREEVEQAFQRIIQRVVPGILVKAAKANDLAVLPEDVSYSLEVIDESFQESADNISEGVVSLMKEYVDQVVRHTLKSIADVGM